MQTLIGMTRDGVPVLARDMSADREAGALPFDPAAWEAFTRTVQFGLLPL